MKSSKVIQYLKTLSTVELEKFEEYVQSPYFNKHQATIELFLLLKPHHPTYAEEEISKEKLFGQLFPQEVFKEKKLYDTSRYLLVLLTDFLVDQSSRQRKIEREYLFVIQELMDRKLDQYVPRLLRDAEQQLEKIGYQDGNYFFQRFSLAQLTSLYLTGQNNRSMEVEYRKIMRELNHFSLLEKLRISIAILNRKAILADEQDTEVVKEAMALYEAGGWNHAPTIQLYYLLLKTLTTEENQDGFYDQFSLHLKSHKHRLPKGNLYEFYGTAISFCSQRYKQGEMKFVKELFSLYQQMLEEELLFADDSSTNINFKNVVTLALKLKEFDWANQFITKYAKYLPDASQEGVMSYSLANLHFAKGEFTQAQHYLMQVEFLDPFYRLNYDMLLLKIYYEVGEADSLFARCDAFRKFVQRNKSLSHSNQLAYGNMARLIKKLAKIKFDQKGNPKKIAEEIHKTSPLVERNWLQDKIGELS